MVAELETALLHVDSHSVSRVLLQRLLSVFTMKFKDDAQDAITNDSGNLFPFGREGQASGKVNSYCERLGQSPALTKAILAHLLSASY